MRDEMTKQRKKLGLAKAPEETYRESSSCNSYAFVFL